MADLSGKIVTGRKPQEVDGVPDRYRPAGEQFLEGSRQRYTLTFEPNSAKYNALTIEQGGTIQQINASSGTKVFKSISTSPFQQQVGTGDSVSEGDIITAELDHDPTAKEIVRVTVGYDDVSVTSTIPENGNYRYLYALNIESENVQVIDQGQNTSTGNHPVIATISLPTGIDFIGIHYRPYDKKIWLFGASYRVSIDADPNSNNFNTIIDNQNDLPLNAEVTEYDWKEDVFYIQEYAIGKLVTYDVDTNSIIFDYRAEIQNIGASKRMSFDSFLGLLYMRISQGSRWVILDRNWATKWFRESYRGEKHVFNPNNSLFYIIDSNTVQGYQFEQSGLFKQLFSISGLFYTASFTIDIKNNKAIATAFNHGRGYKVYDLDSNTEESNFNSARYNIDYDGVYSFYSGLIYQRDANTDLRVFDLTASTPWINTITLDPTDSAENYKNLRQGMKLLAMNGIQIGW